MDHFLGWVVRLFVDLIMTLLFQFLPQEFLPQELFRIAEQKRTKGKAEVWVAR